MTKARLGARGEWVQAHLGEATRLATLSSGDSRSGARIAEESLAAPGRLGPRSRRSDTRVVDAVLAGIVRRSLAEPAREVPDPADERLGALRALPARRRVAFVLRHYADLSDHRAAVFLGCSPHAVSELAGKAAEALPAEARENPREWLEGAAPAPRYLDSSERGTILRRSRRRRALRAAGVGAAIAVGVAGGLRIPALLREPDAPDARDRIREIRRVMEAREADLPFDPDDAGPGTSRPFRVVDGVVGGTLWSLSGFRNEEGRPCLQLVVGYDFGSRSCLGPARTPVVALVTEDERHEATFVSGMVSPRVDSLEFVGPGVSFMDVTIGHEAPGDPEPQLGFFGIALPDRLLSVESREAGRRLGYQVVPGRLTALDARREVVAHFDLLFAKRR